MKGRGSTAQLDRNVYALFENDVPAVMAREPNAGLPRIRIRHGLQSFEISTGRLRPVRLTRALPCVCGRIGYRPRSRSNPSISTAVSYAGPAVRRRSQRHGVGRRVGRAHAHPLLHLQFEVFPGSARRILHGCRLTQDSTTGRAARRLNSKPSSPRPWTGCCRSMRPASDLQFEGLTFKVSDGLLEVLPSLPLDRTSGAD